MLIIFEGPDGSGKTTLIKKLRDRIDADPVVHDHGAYLTDKRIAHHYARSIYAALNGEDVIMDRSWLCEPIYGQVMRGHVSRLAHWETAALERAAKDAGAIVVLCRPPYDACEEAWSSRLESEYPQKKAQLIGIYALYGSHSLDWRDRFPVVDYDYTTDPSGDAAIALIARFAKVGLVAEPKLEPETELEPSSDGPADDGSDEASDDIPGGVHSSHPPTGGTPDLGADGSEDDEGVETEEPGAADDAGGGENPPEGSPPAAAEGDARLSRRERRRRNRGGGAR